VFVGLGKDVSETECLATAEEFEFVPCLHRYVSAVYEDHIWRHPLWAPPNGLISLCALTAG